MKIIYSLLVLVISLVLCGCPSPEIVIFRNNSTGVVRLQSGRSRPITIPVGAETALQIQVASDVVLYSDHSQFHLSSTIWEVFGSEEFRLFGDPKYGSSTEVCIITPGDSLYLARKIDKTGQIVLPKNQPKGFPLKLR